MNKYKHKCCKTLLNTQSFIFQCQWAFWKGLCWAVALRDEPFPFSEETWRKMGNNFLHLKKKNKDFSSIQEIKNPLGIGVNHILSTFICWLCHATCKRCRLLLANLYTQWTLKCSAVLKLLKLNVNIYLIPGASFMRMDFA